MFIFFCEFCHYVHVTPFEIAVRLSGLLISTVFIVLHDEQISLTGEFNREHSLWAIFLPLWSTDIICSYFNLLIFSRRILFHKKLEVWLSQNGLSLSRPYRPPWFRFIKDLLYALLCSFSLFMFKLLLYQKLVQLDSRLTYNWVFLPLICLMPLVLLAILVQVCTSCCF
ncbi:hypothetical protein CSKR_111013 [Clonorchis sinensis]|uniref:Uncharacterized protein n=1 Tax=Clonorchis sinensis TaxID=79923 RepID=A0A3R7C9I6_CLOSI|nr:hypothetical protein CSKR_111013 [Clonorchis sinensis]